MAPRQGEAGTSLDEICRKLGSEDTADNGSSRSENLGSR
jgi:hypothetical protein